MNIINKLNSILIEAQQNPIIVDITDQEAAMKALHDTRGPCVGWKDFVAGNDYQPPYVWNTSDQSKVHKGRIRSVNITSPAIPIGPIDTKNINPHSKKYGGIRPWAPNELLQVLLRETGDRDSEGLIPMIAKKNSIARSYHRSQMPYDKDESISLGSTGALRGLTKDLGMPGVRFTSFIGSYIEESMTSGTPAGYNDEYRNARGLLLDWSKHLSKIEKAAYRYQDLLGKQKDPKVKDELNRLRQAIISASNPIRNRLGTIDREPSPQNEYGYLVSKLTDLGDEILQAVDQMDLNKLIDAKDLAERVREEIVEQEDIYKERGPRTGTMITKSKDAPPIRMAPLTVTDKESGKELEISAKHVLDKELAPAKMKSGKWLFSYTIDDKERTKTISDPVAFLQDRNGMSHDEASQLINMRSDGEDVIPVQAGPDTPAGNLRFISGSGGGDYTPTRSYVYDDPKSKEALAKLAYYARYGHGVGEGWSLTLAKKTIEKLKLVIDNYSQSDKNKPTYEIKPIILDYEIQHSDDADYSIVNVIDGEVVKEHIPTRIRAEKIKQQYMQNAHGYVVVDAQNGKELESFDDKESAVEYWIDLNKDPLITTVDYIINDISKESYGQYADDLLEICAKLKLALNTRDVEEIIETGDDLSFLESEINTKKKLGKTEIALQPLSQQQYRVLLRIYGISKYPEKGTIDDPEIDENGELSEWAKNGYPAYGDSNKEMSDELGVSSVRISQIRKRIDAALPQMIAQIQKNLEESKKLDEIDFKIINELRVKLSTIFKESILNSESEYQLLG